MEGVVRNFAIEKANPSYLKIKNQITVCSYWMDWQALRTNYQKGQAAERAKLKKKGTGGL